MTVFSQRSYPIGIRENHGSPCKYIRIFLKRLGGQVKRENMIRITEGVCLKSILNAFDQLKMLPDDLNFGINGQFNSVLKEKDFCRTRSSNSLDIQ